MKKNLKYALISLVVSLIIIFIALFFYIKLNFLGYAVYGVDYSVGDYTGFNLDADAIHFGTTMPGIILTRTLEITTAKEAVIEIYFSDIEYITTSENNFFLNAGENKSVSLNLILPENASKGYYNGKAVVIYHKPKN